MEKKRKIFRINEDMLIRIHLKTNGEVVSIAGRDLQLVLHTPLKKEIKVEFAVSGNTMRFTYPGIAQKEKGWYSMTVWENRGKLGESAHDICNAFKLVDRLCDNDGLDGAETESVDYDADIDIITRSGIYSDSVKYIETMTAEKYGQITPDKETMYIIVAKKEDIP